MTLDKICCILSFCLNYLEDRTIKSQEKRTRINDEIRALKVRLIGENGDQIGLVSIKEALEKAAELNLDLVEVSASPEETVCKIMDYGKKIFEQKKKKRLNNSSKPKALKQIEFKPNIGESDLLVKKMHIIKFLKEGHKVRLSIKFSGRELKHTSIGIEKLNNLIEELLEFGKLESKPSMEGKKCFAMMSP